MGSPSLVFCMAGIYRRFRDAGYGVPKFLLPVDGRPVLDRVIGALAPTAALLVANRRDQEHAEAIQAVAQRHHIPPESLLFIGDTAGQAETAMIAARALVERGLDGPVLFHNVDTIAEGRDLAAIAALLGRADGTIDVFDHDSPAYSYVRLADGRGPRAVVEIAEKRVISRHATTGLYGFASPAAYLDWAGRTGQRSAGEFYISDVYRTMLDHGATVLADPDGGGATIVLGTPAEYQAYRRDHGA